MHNRKVALAGKLVLGYNYFIMMSVWKFCYESQVEKESVIVEKGGIEKNIYYNFENDPYHYVINTFCNRWKFCIIRGIAFDGATRFNRFTKQLPISEKVLTTTLRELVADGLIQRNVYPEVPVRVEYTLTEAGESLMPLLDLMYDWGWKRMKELDMEIDPLGEMWHGYREKDETLMRNPFKK